MTETVSALWINSTFAGFDAAITTAIHHLYEIGGGFFTPFFEFISLLGKGGAFLILLSLLLTFYKPTRRFGTAMCLGLALGALVTNCCLKVLIARARPYSEESSIYYQLWQLVGMHTHQNHSCPFDLHDQPVAVVFLDFFLLSGSWLPHRYNQPLFSVLQDNRIHTLLQFLLNHKNNILQIVSYS